MEFRTLKLEELDKWLDHCLYVFNKGEYSEGYRQYFKNHWMNDPWRDLESIFVATHEDQIVSTVRVFHRKIYLNGQIVDMGGIGEVSTRPEYQGRGLAAKLFSMAIKRMQELDLKVSMLGAAYEKIGYYNKLGWRSTPRCFNVSAIKAGDNFNFNLNLNLRPVDFMKDISQISLIHEAYSKKLNGVIVRHDKDYWNNWVRKEAKNLYVVEANNNIIAYVDFDSYDKTIRIREYGELFSESSLFSPLVSRLAAMLDLEEGEVVYDSRIKSTFEINRTIEETNEMIRLINSFKLDNIYIETTEQLVNIFEKLTFWDIDGF